MLDWVNIAPQTDRLRVIGGWIVRVRGGYDSAFSYSTVFVPDPTYNWRIV
jgi:hypothetical protein